MGGHSMKKKTIILVLTLLCTMTNIFATIFPGLDFNRFESEDVVTLITKTVPDEVVDAFIGYTQHYNSSYQDAMRLYLLAVGKHESEWKYTRSFKANSNGTYDVGYLMLNENNICDPIFVKNFIPKPSDEYVVKNEQEYYLATCINFFKYLYNRYGLDACYAYNAGERRYIENRLPASTIKYKESVMENLYLYINELYSIADARITAERRLKEYEMNLGLVVYDSSRLIEKMYTYVLYTKHFVGKRVPKYIVLTRVDMILPSNEETLKRIAKRKIIIYLYDSNDEDIKLRRIISSVRGDDVETEHDIIGNVNCIVI